MNRKQQDFSQKYNINRSTIASIESGNDQPKVETAKVIASIINIEWSLFFEEEE